MKFTGHIVGMDKKTDIESQDVDVLIELTDTKKDGTVEIAFDDRNERFYVRFRLQDLVREVMDLGQTE